MSPSVGIIGQARRVARPRGRSTRLVVEVVDARGRRQADDGLGRWLARVAAPRAVGTLCVAIVGDACVRRLNRLYRGVDRATDVLSFPASDVGRDRPVGRRPTEWRVESMPPSRASFLGDVVIARGIAARQALLAQHDTGTELKILALHGLLHLLGYDHEVDGGTMARLERQLRRAGRLREGLIERTRGTADVRARARR